MQRIEDGGRQARAQEGRDAGCYLLAFVRVGGASSTFLNRLLQYALRCFCHKARVWRSSPTGEDGMASDCDTAVDDAARPLFELFNGELDFLFFIINPAITHAPSW